MNLTQPVATVIQGALTASGAVIGVLLAWLLLAGKVKDLRSALDTSQSALDRHAQLVDDKLAAIERRFSTFDERFESVNDQLGANLQSVNSVRGTVEDIEASQAADLDRAEDVAVQPADARRDLSRATLVAAWSAIRDRLEAIAADTEVDGRTRAALGRVDRRNYHDLIAELGKRGLLGRKAADFTRAATLRYANHRRFQGPEAAAEMEALRDRLA